MWCKSITSNLLAFPLVSWNFLMIPISDLDWKKRSFERRGSLPKTWLGLELRPLDLKSRFETTRRLLILIAELTFLIFFFFKFTGGTDIISCFAGQNPTVPVYRGEIQTRNLGMAVESWNDDGKKYHWFPNIILFLRFYVPCEQSGSSKFVSRLRPLEIQVRRCKGFEKSSCLLVIGGFRSTLFVFALLCPLL